MTIDRQRYRKKRVFLRWFGLIASGFFLFPVLLMVMGFTSSGVGEFSALFMASYLMDRTLASVLGVGLMILTFVSQAFLVGLFLRGWYEIYGEDYLTI